MENLKKIKRAYSTDSMGIKSCQSQNMTIFVQSSTEERTFFEKRCEYRYPPKKLLKLGISYLTLAARHSSKTKMLKRCAVAGRSGMSGQLLWHLFKQLGKVYIFNQILNLLVQYFDSFSICCRHCFFDIFQSFQKIMWPLFMGVLINIFRNILKFIRKRGLWVEYCK